MVVFAFNNLESFLKALILQNLEAYTVLPHELEQTNYISEHPSRHSQLLYKK